jgi:dihydrofolate reductase
MSVRVDLNLSLDGVVVPEDPMGPDWQRITAAYTGTRTFRERVFGLADGSGTTGVDDRYGREYFEGVGAEIIGAGMFGFHAHPDDPDWTGWWGDEPPFRSPVLVLTHREHAPIEFGNGTRFEFLATTPEDAFERARAIAGDGDVRIGGGATVVRDFLAAGLVDRLHVAIVPIVLGRGARLWGGLDLDGYSVSSEIAESGVVHVTFAR